MSMRLRRWDLQNRRTAGPSGEPDRASITGMNARRWILGLIPQGLIPRRATLLVPFQAALRQPTDPSIEMPLRHELTHVAAKTQ
jgi:hypothetical protein